MTEQWLLTLATSAWCNGNAGGDVNTGLGNSGNINTGGFNPGTLNTVRRDPLVLEFAFNAGTGNSGFGHNDPAGSKQLGHSEPASQLGLCQ